MNRYPLPSNDLRCDKAYHDDLFPPRSCVLLAYLNTSLSPRFDVTITHLISQGSQTMMLLIVPRPYSHGAPQWPATDNNLTSARGRTLVIAGDSCNTSEAAHQQENCDTPDFTC